MNFVLVLAIIICTLLILIVLIQNPKGGGIAANFSSGNQIMGVRRTNDFVEKATWGLAIALLLIALTTNVISTTRTGGEDRQSILKEQAETEGFEPVQDLPEAPAQENTSSPIQTTPLEQP